MKRKLLSLVMTGAMILSLAACGGSTGSGSGSNGGSNGGNPNPPSQTAGETLATVGDITLNMWCIATESDSNRHSYEAAIAAITGAKQTNNQADNDLKNLLMLIFLLILLRF